MGSRLQDEDAVPPHELLQAIRRASQWAGLALIALGWLAAVAHASDAVGVYPLPVFVGAIAVLAGLTSAGLHASTQVGSPPSAFRALIGLCYAALIAHLFLSRPWAVPYPPLLHVTGAAVTVAPVVYRLRVAIPMACSYAIVLSWLRIPLIGTAQAALEGTIFILAALMVAAGKRSLDNMMSAVQEAHSRRWQAETDLARSRRRRLEQNRWDSMIHDQVLSAISNLTSVTTITPTRATRQLASEVLESIRSGPVETDDWHQTWAGESKRLGIALDVKVDCIGLPPAEVLTAGTDAVTEAIRNLARHSGRREGRVDGHLSRTRLDLCVSDHGRGFDPATIPFGSGIDTSLRNRLNSVGGRALVQSAPGLGCRVRLLWEAEPVPAIDSPSWQLRAFAPAMGFGIALMAMNLAMGARQWPSWPAPQLGWISSGVVVLLTLASARLRPSSSSWPVLCAALSVVPCVAAAVAPVTQDRGWAHWYLAAMIPAFGAAAFRFRFSAAVLAAAASVVGVFVTDMLRGATPGYSVLLDPSPVLAATVVAGGVVRLGLDRSIHAVSDEAARAGRLELELAMHTEQVSVSGVRRSELEKRLAGPLGALAAGHPVSERERLQLRVTAEGLRDLLAARALTLEIQDGVRDARLRGAIVTISTNEEAGRADDAPADLAILLRALVDAAGSGTQINLAWIRQPEQDRARVTCVYPRATAGVTLHWLPTSAEATLEVEIGEHFALYKLGCPRYEGGPCP